MRTTDGVQLDSRVGIGAGELWTAIVGDVADRWELLVVGDALTQAVRSLAAATAAEVVVSPAVWEQIGRHAIAIPRAGGYLRLKSVNVPGGAASTRRAASRPVRRTGATRIRAPIGPDKTRRRSDRLAGRT